MHTLIMYELGYNQNYYTSTLMLLIKFVMCSDFSRTKFVQIVWREDQSAQREQVRQPPVRV